MHVGKGVHVAGQSYRHFPLFYKGFFFAVIIFTEGIWPMKKLLSLLLTAVLAVCLTMSACDIKLTDKDFASEGVATVVVASEEMLEYEINLADVKDGEGAFSLLQYLVTNKNLTLECTYSSYGPYLTAFGDASDTTGKKMVRQDLTSGTYLYIYTSVEKDYDVSGYATTVEYKDKTLTSSGVGIGSMTVTDGAIIYIGTIKW